MILPVLGNSGAGHWQTLWQSHNPGFRRVEQADWDEPRLEAWVANVEESVRSSAGVVLVAHSLACALVAHWARVGSVERVTCALLVAPADPERSTAALAVRGFAPLPLDPLPFPSRVVASANDPHCTPARARELAAAWRASFVDAGPVGHINVASGHGRWVEGEVLLAELVHGSAAGAREAAAPAPAGHRAAIRDGDGLDSSSVISDIIRHLG